MATKPNVKAVQDMPPSGGYPKINTQKGIRPRGPSGFAMWGAVFAMTTYGFYQLHLTNLEKADNNKQNRDARMAILPFLKAEQDRKLLQAINQVREREREIMKHDPDFDVDESVYKLRKTPPQLAQ